jgi:O-antigen/teichoic acid export membrane protein
VAECSGEVHPNGCWVNAASAESKGTMMSKYLFQSLIGVLSSLIGTIVIFIIAGRSLGPVDFSHFSVSYATCSLFGILFDFGYMTRLLNELRAVGPEQAVVLSRETLVVKFCLFAVTSLGVFTFAIIYSLDLMLIAYLWSGICLISMANLLGATFRATGRHFIDSRNNFFGNVSGAILAVYLSLGGATQNDFALVFIVIGIVHCLATIRTWRRFGSISQGKVTCSSIRREFLANIPYSIDALGQRSFFFLDVMILSLVAPSSVVGLYQAAQKLAQGANIMAQPLNNVLLPRLAQSVGNKSGFQNHIRQAMKIYILVAVSAGLGMFFIGPLMIELLFSSKFSDAKSFMPFFALLTVIRYWAASQAVQITALGMQKVRTIINLFSLTVFIIVSYYLSKEFSGIGIIIAFMISFTIIALGANMVKRKTNAWNG